MAGFLLNVGPNFVDLQMHGAQVSHLRVHQGLASLPSENQQTHNRVAIQLRDALGATNRVSLKQQLESEHRPILGNVHRVENALVRFRIRPLALRAAESAQTIPVLSEALTIDIAHPAGHGLCGGPEAFLVTVVNRLAEQVCAVLICLVVASATTVTIDRSRVEVRIAIVIGVTVVLEKYLLLTQAL
jgi:hypothetical protein